MQRNKTLAKSLFVMLLWGSLFPAVKLGMKEWSIESTGDILLFAGLRFVICGGIISLFAAGDKASYKSAKSVILPILLSGFFSIILHYACTYSALGMTDASKTAILKQVGALFYICFSFLFFKDDRFTLPKLFGALLGFGGIVAINSGVDGLSFNFGDALILTASFASVASNVISKNVFRKTSHVTATGISQFFGGVVLLFAGLVMGGGMGAPTLKGFLVLTYICVASIVSYLMWFSVLKNGELSKLFIIKFAEPLFACVFGAALLGENVFKPQYIIAFILISLGIYISHIKKES